MMLDVDTILGLPRPTKKPTSLKKPRQPPPPKYINKERALAIAKKFKITQIGKVSVRAGSSNAVDEPPRVSLQSEKVLTRRILLEREKGLETAMNTKDSAVGKCILGRNDYETRRLGVEFDKLNEDNDRKSYQLLKRKSVFVQQRGLTLTQNGIVFDPTAATKHRESLDTQAKGDSLKPLPGIQTTKTGEGTSGDSMPKIKRDKSPSYMRPLSCDRTRSVNSQVAEAERFLATPTMRRFVKGEPDEDSTVLALKSVSEVNAVDFDGYKAKSNTSPHSKSPARRIFQTETVSDRRQSELPEIAESISSENDNVFVTGEIQKAKDGKMQFKNAENFPITKALNRSKSMGHTERKSGLEPNRRHSTAYSGQRREILADAVRTPSKVDEMKTDTDEVAATEEKGRQSSLKSRRRSRRKSSTFSSQSLHFKHRRKHRKTRVSFSQRQASNPFNTSEPSKDPRFTELTSHLVPDSAGAFDLYRAMGRLSVLERLEQSGIKSSGQPRSKLRKIGQIKKSDNLKMFNTLL